MNIQVDGDGLFGCKGGSVLGLENVSRRNGELMVCSNCQTNDTPFWRRSPDGQPLCNACGLYYRAKGKQRPIWVRRQVPKKKHDSQVQCSNCGTMDTPLWRRDDQSRTICNACGLFFRSRGYHRPAGARRASGYRRRRKVSTCSTVSNESVSEEIDMERLMEQGIAATPRRVGRGLEKVEDLFKGELFSDMPMDFASLLGDLPPSPLEDKREDMFEHVWKPQTPLSLNVERSSKDITSLKLMNIPSNAFLVPVPPQHHQYESEAFDNDRYVNERQIEHNIPNSFTCAKISKKQLLKQLEQKPIVDSLKTYEPTVPIEQGQDNPFEAFNNNEPVPTSTVKVANVSEDEEGSEIAKAFTNIDERASFSKAFTNIEERTSLHESRDLLNTNSFNENKDLLNNNSFNILNTNSFQVPNSLDVQCKDPFMSSYNYMLPFTPMLSCIDEKQCDMKFETEGSEEMRTEHLKGARDLLQSRIDYLKELYQKTEQLLESSAD